MRIIVFGAGGFVGGWICEELSQRKDVECVACVRRWASAVRVARRGVEISQVDLEDTNKVTSLLAGADVIVNASMPVPAREAELVARLFDAAERVGVRRFIQFSSAAVYGNRTGDVNEGMPPAPIDDYSRGKAEMERRLIEAGVSSALHLFILRPSIIYGPFSDAWTVRYVQRIVQGRWRGLGRVGEGTCNLAHGTDVAKAAIAACTVDIPPGVHVLNINGSEMVTWNEYIERLGDALGLHDRAIPSAMVFRGMAVAANVLRVGANVGLVRSVYRGASGPTRAAMKSAQGVTKLYPSAGELKLLGRKVRYSAEEARRVLGVSSFISLDEGISQSVSWCRVHGLV